MSRYGPPPPRDRSPPRYDRRPSTYSLGGSSYRGTGDPQTPIDRDPPRGPRADSFRGGYPYTPAGRGRGSATFPTRPGDTWRDRERDRERDTRPAQSYRTREDDRADWPRRERDLGPLDRPAPPRGSYPPRDRSASPVRGRRDSRESLPPLITRQSDSASSFRGGGGLGRGRGRGDWDRPRDRTSFVAERERDRDLFGNRSPSRDSSWRDRDIDRARPPGPDSDRGDRYVGRDRSRERRDHDIWQRDHSPARMSSGPGARIPSPANSTGTHGPLDRGSKMDYELTRRKSITATPSSVTREVRRDGDQGDYFQRGDLRRDSSYSSLHQPPAPQPSATAGLDYGPPPSATATTPAEKPPLSRAPPPKPISPATTSAPFQPPSGPKADRAASSSMPRPSAPYETPKGDQYPLRSVSSSGSIAAPKSATELFPNKVDQKIDIKPAPTTSSDKSMPPNVPSGPRSASFGSSFRSRPPPSDMSPQFTPPKLPATDPRAPQIPTGPRLDRDRDIRDTREGPRSQGVPISSSRSWISPEYTRVKPSIMSPINRDHPTFPPTGPRSQSILPPRSDKGRPYPPSIMNSAISAAASGKPGQPSIMRSPGNVPSNADSVNEDVDMSLPMSSDEEGDEDEFDEDDFAASEAKFQKERKALEMRKPPPFLQDTVIRNLLIRVQFLNMIANDIRPETLGQVDIKESDAKDGSKQDLGLPSPEGPSEDDDKSEIKQPIPRGRPLREPPVNPIPTPPIEDLPYLGQRESDAIVFDESDDEIQHEAVTMLVRQEFERCAFDRQQDLQALHDEYRSQYSYWKHEVTRLDHSNREIHISPAPASPAPSATPSVAPSISHERTRGGRNTTEADLQAAIALSQQTMKEEEERREREALESSVPNYEHEAVIPPMLNSEEARMDEFEDTSGLIIPGVALDLLRYIPPEDDFTPEEQRAFITAYCLTPKKWGKIAEALPDRTYKHCISHYYLTKAEAKYKEIWRRSQPKRKRGRASTKPRSTALMSELAYRDGEEAVVAVTDTGRPKRAAAPTFGDNGNENDAAIPTPPAKRVAGGKDTGGESPAVKPARGRKTGATTKTRRTKAQIQADLLAAQAAQAAQVTGELPNGPADNSPPKLPVSRDRSRTLIRADETSMGKADIAPALPMSRIGDSDLPQYAMSDDRNAQAAAAAAQALNQPTSYWSVPEQTKFPQLIAYYGRDFASIADFMKTKTSTMIKNHYNRQLADGKNELEELARQAESKRASGETLGRPPSPAVQTKRRYEATPSTAGAQHLGRPMHDQQPAEGDRLALQPKQGYTDDFPSNTVQRNFTGDLVANARADGPVALLPAKHEETPRSGLLSKPLVGPRMGFFREDNAPFSAARQNASRDNSPHQHPLRPGDHRLGDIGHRIPASSPRQLHLGPPRDNPAITSNPPNQNPIAASAMHNERFGLPQHLHARNTSATAHNQASLEQAKDLASLRQLDPLSRPYSMIPPQSGTPPPTVGSMLRNAEGKYGNPPVSATAEPPKPAPAKRSNIMSILNDDPPEPKPVKRASSDSQNRGSVLSPQAGPQAGSNFDPSRNPLRLDGSPAEIDRKRTPQGFAPHPLREQQSGYGAGQSSSQNETWLDKFDPRPQSGMSDHRNLHQSPRPAQYSVVPPGSSNLRMEPSRPGESVTDHRRAFLGQLSQSRSNPSPPPQQTPYRSISGSSQPPHSRVGSIGFSQPQSSQTQAHQMQQASGIPSSHPHSTNSTPVSSLHHGRSSIDYDQHQRQTIQQHMLHMQAPSRDTAVSYRQQDREREQLRMEAEHDALRAREQEAALARDRHEREGFRVAEREPYGYHRAIPTYGPPPPRENETRGGLHGHQVQHQHSQQGQAPPSQQQRPLGFPESLQQRSYTPQPHHQSQLQQQQPPQYGSAHGSGPPPPGPGQSQFHHHHGQQNGPKSLHQGPAPPPPQPQGVHPNHPAYGSMGHFRTASQDERR